MPDDDEEEEQYTPTISDLKAQFKYGRKLSRAEIARLFAHIEKLEDRPKVRVSEYQLALEAGGWIRSLPGSRYVRRR